MQNPRMSSSVSRSPWTSAEQSIEHGLAVLEEARLCRARSIRVFTGKVGSADATGEQWARAARSLQRLCDASREDGILWSVETHARNLMDTVQSTLRLIGAVREVLVNSQVNQAAHRK